MLISHTDISEIPTFSVFLIPLYTQSTMCIYSAYWPRLCAHICLVASLTRSYEVYDYCTVTYYFTQRYAYVQYIKKRLCFLSVIVDTNSVSRFQPFFTGVIRFNRTATSFSWRGILRRNWDKNLTRCYSQSSSMVFLDLRFLQQQPKVGAWGLGFVYIISMITFECSNVLSLITLYFYIINIFHRNNY